MSVVQEIISYAPYAGAALGYGAGQVAEQVARNNIAENRSALMGAHDSIQSPDLVNRSLARRAVTQLAILGAAAGFTIGQAVSPAAERPADDAAVAMVVDKSYSTKANDSYKTINSLAVRIDETDGISISPIVAQDSTSLTPDKNTSFEDLLQEEPYGAPSVNKATSAAVDMAGSEDLAAAVVITDGNSAGNVRTITKKADDKGVAITVVNTGEAESRVARNLARVAERTGGQYWHVTAKNQNDIPDELRDSLQPESAGESQPKDRIAWGVVGAVLVSATVAAFKRRKHETAVS